jgi:hypothetical protein
VAAKRADDLVAELYELTCEQMAFAHSTCAQQEPLRFPSPDYRRANHLLHGRSAQLNVDGLEPVPKGALCNRP